MPGRLSRITGPRPSGIPSSFVLQILGSLALAVALLAGLADRLHDAPNYCRLIAAAACLGAIAILVVAAVDVRCRTWALPALAVQLICLVATFAGIYHGFGVLRGVVVVHPTWSEAIYMSVVVWTTLGFGDYLPRPETQLIVAAEAMMGYIFFGLIVGLVGRLFDRQ